MFKVKTVDLNVYEVKTDSIDSLIEWLLPNPVCERMTLVIAGGTYEFNTHQERLAFASGLQKAKSMMLTNQMKDYISTLFKVIKE